jgi:N-methylhydantoinase B/oxoprolinase/acetone carboxylase alpha subunit
MPDGCYEFEDKLDDDGITGNPIRILAKLIVQGDAVAVDLSGQRPQQCDAGLYVFRRVLRPDGCGRRPIASNAGCYRPVTIIAPPGLVVNAADPAPVVHRLPLPIG